MDLDFLEKKARQVRSTCIQMAHDGCEGHLSSSLSYVDILVALYYGWLNISPDRVEDVARDRFILSKGHGCTPLYVVLADRGFIPREWLFRYACEESPIPNHSCRHALSILETSAGSLGHGLGIATGMLYGLKLKDERARAVVLLGDGECNEGSVWEAAMFAAAQKLERLVAIVDYNDIQAVGRSDEIMGHTSLEEKFRAFGWEARTIDGNSISDIQAAFDDIPFRDGFPSAIIAKTRSGVSFIGDDVSWHYRKPSEGDLRRAIEELGEQPIHME